MHRISSIVPRDRRSTLPFALPKSPASSHGVRTLTRFDPARGELPESVTIDRHGNLYLSMATYIAKLTPGGVFSRYAELPLPSGAFALGVKMGPDGCVYCATGAFHDDPDAAAVFRAAGKGRVERVTALDPRGFPNDLVFDVAGNMYVTEPFLGRIYRIDALGAAEIWLEHPLLLGDDADPVLEVHSFGVDGIAFDAGERNLYVGNLDAGTIIRVPMQADGRAGAPEVFVQNGLLKGADGIAFDVDGTLYVAVNGGDRLVSINARGALRVHADGAPLDAPSSLVFGTRRGDEQTLYIASFAINRATGAHPGPPEPALLALATDAPGLPL